MPTKRNSSLVHWWVSSIRIALLATLAFGSAAADQLKIVTTTPDLASIAREIGGDFVSVESITKGYQDAHTIQAKPSYMLKLNRADLLIYTGLELEVGWLPLLIQGARNPKITFGSPGHLDASTSGIPIRDIPTEPVDRSMGDVHPEGNPHYLLDPRNGVRAAHAIAERLTELRPENDQVINQNLVSFVGELQTGIDRWKSTTIGIKNRKIVSCHQQWEYFADFLELEIAGYIETKPGIPPSPRHIRNLIAQVRRDSLQVLVCSNYSNPTAGESISDRTGIAHLLLPVAPGGVPGVDGYLELFDHLVENLTGAFSERE